MKLADGRFEIYPRSIETERLQLIMTSDENNTYASFNVLKKGDMMPIGTLQLFNDGEIWYSINKKFRRCGYATESMQELIEKSPRKDFYLLVIKGEKSAIRLLKKLGFKKGETLRWYLVFKYHKD